MIPWSLCWLLRAQTLTSIESSESQLWTAQLCSLGWTQLNAEPWTFPNTLDGESPPSPPCSLPFFWLVTVRTRCPVILAKSKGNCSFRINNSLWQAALSLCNLLLSIPASALRCRSHVSRCQPLGFWEFVVHILGIIWCSSTNPLCRIRKHNKCFTVKVSSDCTGGKVAQYLQTSWQLLS